MPIYEFKCRRPDCSRVFKTIMTHEAWLSAARDAFRGDVYCEFCGEPGGESIQPVPIVHVYAGTWPKNASPELAGRAWGSKAEQAAQAAAAGSVVVDTGDYERMPHTLPSGRHADMAYVPTKKAAEKPVLFADKVAAWAKGRGVVTIQHAADGMGVEFGAVRRVMLDAAYFRRDGEGFVVIDRARREGRSDAVAARR